MGVVLCSGARQALGNLSGFVAGGAGDSRHLDFGRHCRFFYRAVVAELALYSRGLRDGPSRGKKNDIIFMFLSCGF